MSTANGEELPWQRSEAQEELDQAPQADGGQVRAFQTKAVGRPAQKRFQRHGHRAVHLREDADFCEAESQMTGIERQTKADQAEAKA